MLIDENGQEGITITSRLNTHLLKYAFFGKKNRVQDLLVEHVVNRHVV